MRGQKAYDTAIAEMQHDLQEGSYYYLLNDKATRASRDAAAYSTHTYAHTNTRTLMLLLFMLLPLIDRKSTRLNSSHLG
jgi:hypothetical protein